MKNLSRLEVPLRDLKARHTIQVKTTTPIQPKGRKLHLVKKKMETVVKNSLNLNRRLIVQSRIRKLYSSSPSASCKT